MYDSWVLSLKIGNKSGGRGAWQEQFFKSNNFYSDITTFNEIIQEYES